MRVVCCFLEYDDKFLVLARPNLATGEHEWDLPAGKVKANESTEAATVRIVAEETGYTAVAADVTLLGTFNFISSRNEPYTMFAYCLKLSDPLEANQNFATEWVSTAECLAKPNLIKNLRQLLELTGYTV